MASKNYDAVVIGGGPGGYVASIRLGQLGLKALCVERESMGGVCLNWGCIPSKALIAATGLVEKVRHAETMGIDATGVKLDVPKMQQWKDGIVKKLITGVSGLVKGNGGEILIGDAKLINAKTVEVTTPDGKRETVTAQKAIIIATGAQVIQIPGFKTDGKTVITAREAVSLGQAPKRMVLIGGGVIGLELGMVYQKLGTELIVVEMMEQLLPGVDPDLVRVVEKRLKKGGAEVLLGARAKSCTTTANGAKVTVEHLGKSIDYDCDNVLVAVGFRPNSANLGLEAIGVKTDERGHITVDDRMMTNVPNVYAIGDVTAPPYLAHKASKEGEIAAEVIAGHKALRDMRAMPAAIFTDPEIATVGISETKAKKDGRKIIVGKFPFAALGRAMAVNETEGFFKVIADEASHEVLGVSIVGPEASDLISEAALALEMCAFAEDVALTVHPHPTLGEGMMEAFKHSLKEAIHVMNR